MAQTFEEWEAGYLGKIKVQARHKDRHDAFHARDAEVAALESQLARARTIKPTGQTFEQWHQATYGDLDWSAEQRDAWDAGLTQAQADGAAAVDELILRHRCGCERCSMGSQLCPATASAIAMEKTLLEATVEAALRNAADECNKRLFAGTHNVDLRKAYDAILALIPDNALKEHDAALKQDLKDQLGWMDQAEVEKFVAIHDARLLEPMVKALEEIAKGEGPFSREPLTHAENTIENMKSIAWAAIRQARGSDGAKEARKGAAQPSDLDSLAQSTAEELRHCIDQFEDGWGFNLAMAKDCLLRAFRSALSYGMPAPEKRKGE